MRSPSELSVTSTCRAPACTAASEFAVASPRSLWQCLVAQGSRKSPAQGEAEYRWPSQIQGSADGVGGSDCGAVLFDACMLCDQETQAGAPGTVHSRAPRPSLPTALRRPDNLVRVLSVRDAVGKDVGVPDGGPQRDAV